MKDFVGYRTVDVIDQQNNLQFPMSIMYPTGSIEKSEQIGPYNMNLARNASPLSGEYPLIIISHGGGGSNLVYRTLAYHLASNGFIVGMPEHPFNNKNDNSLAGTVDNLINRPNHIKIVIDWFYNSHEFSKYLKLNNVSIIGHSMGGYTALAIAGGVPTSLPDESVDKLQNQLHVAHDNRIKALVLLAPATTWFSQKGALSDVTCPILVYVGNKDDSSCPGISIIPQSKLMPYGYFVQLILDGISDRSKIQCKIVENAGHFSFLSPFPESMTNAAFPPSQDPAGFNRKDFHDQLNAEVLEFLLHETHSNGSDIKESYEEYLINKVKVNPELLQQGKDKVKHWNKEDWDKYHHNTEGLTKEFVIALTNNLQPESQTVQDLIKKHFAMVSIFWKPTKSNYIGLGQMYKEYLDFKNFYASYHPNLVEFLANAMQIFAENELA